jgi:hypothetical protein
MTPVGDQAILMQLSLLNQFDERHELGKEMMAEDEQ